MIKIDIRGMKEVQQLLKTVPMQASRAAEQALDETAVFIRDAVKVEMKMVFRNPVNYTLNSLKVTKTKGHNMRASVWFKDPDRFNVQHYLVPQVMGGKRRLKGFEHALIPELGKEEYIPGKGARLDSHGNISVGQIRQFMSVIGIAERTAGSTQNMTARSSKRNKKPRDYVIIKRGNRGHLPPGVYERYQSGVGFGAKTKRSLPFGEWQRGRTRGRFSSVIRAKGLRGIVIAGRTGRPIKPLLDFYGIAHKEFAKRFMATFNTHFAAPSAFK